MSNAQDKLGLVEDRAGRVPISPRQRARRRQPWPLFVLVLVTLVVFSTHLASPRSQRAIRLPPHASAIQARCENLKLKPGPPPTFSSRSSSDRFVEGTKPVLIRNATIWTGRVNGLEIVKGDILLDKGMIKALGHVDTALLQGLGSGVLEVDAKGSWVTPGIVDLHSHLGVMSAPLLSGAADTGSRQGITQPWLRALDGLNTHDEAYHLSIAGGVTTALVIPGSGNAIGGQGFVIKLRDTAERTPTSKLLEPPFTLNRTSAIDMSLPPRWRQMKHACGENSRRAYGNTRMDNLWAFRQAYDTARKLKEKQDAYCEKALSDEWAGMGDFPEELQWEALVDVLRGRVKVQVHCYEEVDLDDIVRLTNEFEFPIAAFHHAHETYLVPDLLKKAYGHAPASAMFATNARYKREAYRGSEFAPRILAQNGLQVVMKSDHPILNSRYLLYEAQQAHYYGLPDNIALASVTSTPAQVMGMEHRVGLINEGYDADVVIWDSHPLALGATPKQVFIDGIPQLSSPHIIEKPSRFQKLPQTPNFDKEVADTIKYEGLPPLAPEKSLDTIVVFVNVTKLIIRSKDGEGLIQSFLTRGDEEGDVGMVVVDRGRVACAGPRSTCQSYSGSSNVNVVDLKGGSISPGLVSFGSPLGLQEINGEVSTQDGFVLDPLEGDVPSILGGSQGFVRAADGLQFATRDALLAYRAGVTVGITAPKHRGFISGLSTAFGLGSAHKLEKGALVQEIAAVHVTVGHFGQQAFGQSASMYSVSTQIATLRRLLLGPNDGETGLWFGRVAKGEATLVVDVESADIISTLLLLKKEVEEQTETPIKMTITGAAEAHLLAKELADADIGVVVVPSRPYPKQWQSRRILPGPPLTMDSVISLLISHNVTVGIGIEEPWSARNTRFDAAWAALEAIGEISKAQALALASTNLERLLGLEVDSELADLVAIEAGDIFDFGGKVIGVISPRKCSVEIFQ